jgi:hypothetical protein
MIPLILAAIMLTIVIYLGVLGTKIVINNNFASKMNEYAAQDINIYFDETLLHQSTAQLTGIRNSWLAFIETNKITDINNNWDEDKLKIFASFVTSKSYLFDSSGNGCLLVDKDSSRIINNDGKLGVTLLEFLCKDNNFANKEELPKLSNDILNSKNIYMEDYLAYSLDSNLSYENSKDFINYPLNKYNRIFIQKMIIPYPDCSKELIVLASFKETKVYAPYQNIYLNFQNLTADLEKNSKALVVSTGIFMIIIIICGGMITFLARKDL